MKYLSICLILTLACLLGCDRQAPTGSDFTVNGNRIRNLPQGASLNIEGEDDIGEGLYKHEGSASASTSGLTSESGEAVNDFKTTTPRVWLPGGSGAEGGGADITQSLTMADPKDALQSKMFWLGIGLLAVGGVLWRYGQTQTARYSLIAGGAFVACAFFPGLIVVALIAAIVVNYWPQIMAEIKRMRAQKDATAKTEALRAVTAGGEDLPDTERKLFKAKVAAHASEEDRNTIRAIKKADDLPSERP